MKIATHTTWCLMLVAATVCGCLKRPPAGGPPMMLPQVTVTNPVPQSLAEWDEYPAWLEAVNTVEIKARVSGYLQRIGFEDGTEVKAGAALFQLDQRPFEADQARAAAERQRIEVSLANAQTELKRAEALRGTKAISEEEYDRRASAVRELAAGLEAAKAAEASAQLNLGYAVINAPIDGKLGRRRVSVGDLIPIGGDSAMVTLVSMDPVYAYFDVDENTFAGYAGANPNQRILGVDCELGVAGETGFPHRGKVDFYDNQVNRATGTIRVRGVFANPPRDLIPGQFGRVRLQTGTSQARLLVPEIALASDLTRKVVYVVSATNTVEMRTVKVGRKLGSQVVILDGVSKEDRVVVTGLFLLRPGMPVQISDGRTPPAGPPGSAAPGAQKPPASKQG